MNTNQFFAHSVEGHNPNKWQPLGAHLQAVALLSSRRAEKFGAARLGAVVGLLHDLGKYAHVSDYIEHVNKADAE